MISLYLEEAVGQCECMSLATVNAEQGRCMSSKETIRRVMGTDPVIICSFYCKKCMPEFFINPKGYPVIRAITSKTQDPLFLNYVQHYRKIFIE